MKFLFGILLLACVALFGFIQWGSMLTSTGQNGSALGEMNAEKIILLGMPVVKPSIVLPLSAPAVTVVPDSAPVAASAPLVPVVPSAPVVVPPAVKAPLPAPVPPPLKPVEVAPAPKIVSKVCMEWGEFSGTDLSRAEKELAVLNLGDHLTRRNVEYTKGYWVYMPPLKNQAAVNRKISQLKALGIDDYFVVHEPHKWSNVISLGVFKTREAAEKYHASLKTRGVRTAKVGERNSKLKFVVFVLKELNAEGVSHLSKLHKDFASSELKKVACPN